MPSVWSGLFHGQPGKELELDHLGRFRVFRGQSGEGLVKRDDLVGRRLYGYVVVVQIDVLNAAAVLGALLPPSILDQDAAHGFGRRGEEMPPAVPERLSPFFFLLGDCQQAEIRVVDKCRRLERLARVRMCQGLRCQSAQLVVDQR